MENLVDLPIVELNPIQTKALKRLEKCSAKHRGCDKCPFLKPCLARWDQLALKEVKPVPRDT